MCNLVSFSIWSALRLWCSDYSNKDYAFMSPNVSPYRVQQWPQASYLLSHVLL